MPTITTLRKGWIAVPVFDDETGALDYWDVHADHPDWTSDEPVASVRTLAEAREAARDEVIAERRYRALLRAFGAT